jgi:predicted nucleic acid-binding protein
MLLDSGEAAAIALAHERGWRVILDDQRPRTVAARLGVRIIGTIGVLVRAKQKGVISTLAPLLEDLEAAGFHVSAALGQEALRLAGECPFLTAFAAPGRSAARRPSGA